MDIVNFKVSPTVEVLELRNQLQDSLSEIAQLRDEIADLQQDNGHLKAIAQHVHVFLKDTE